MVSQIHMPLISYSPEVINGEPIFFSSNCLPVKATNFEPAGLSFHYAALKMVGLGEEEDVDSDDQSVTDDRSKDYMPSSDSYKSKGKKKAGDQQDHYALLGLGHLRFLATEEQIRRSYRETALKHHPDKQAALLLAEESEEAKQAKMDEIENHFKAIQEAYEVLIDPVKRRIYDSTDEFDDEIPSECAPQDFFKVFGPVFMRNGRWSVTQSVPSLGDDNTPLGEVDSFYDFWFGFKSWREFPHADEFDLDQAESRDHKRWMERQNAKLGERARKEEHTRIRTFVENAYKKDPRILRRREEEKAEKQKKKEAKFLARKMKEEEAVRAAEEARKRKEEEEKQAAEAALNQKKQKEKEKKLLRKERTRLRTLSAEVVSKNLLGLSASDVEGMCMKFETEQLRGLCDNIEQKEVSEKAQLLKDALQGKSADESKVDQKNSLQNGSSSDSIDNKGNILSGYEKREKPWSKEEIELLRKGMQKYPKGTSRRWEVISEYIGTGRSVDEILKATKTVLLQKPDSAKAFDSFLEKRKPVQSIVSPLSSRDETKDASVNGVENNGPVGVPQKTESEKSLTSGSNQKKPETENPSGPAAQSVSNGAPSGSDQDSWTPTQERALIRALKTFPKETSQRWERVTAAVPGKTKIQCMKKFAILKESFRNKKSAE
ncbi:hypothetical protein AMTRI_Chr01g103980 [Amborella trichopoda]